MCYRAPQGSHGSNPSLSFLPMCDVLKRACSCRFLRGSFDKGLALETQPLPFHNVYRILHSLGFPLQLFRVLGLFDAATGLLGFLRHLLRCGQRAPYGSQLELLHRNP